MAEPLFQRIAFLGIGLIALMPGIGILQIEDLKKLNYLVFLFIGSAISMGRVLTATKSLDDKTLFVTNGGGGGVKPTLVAFDVVGPGRLAGRRDFATLDAGTGDGLALDADGRIYVTSNPGVQVFDKTGKVVLADGRRPSGEARLDLAEALDDLDRLADTHEANAVAQLRAALDRLSGHGGD